MDGILHHLRDPGMIIPLQTLANHGFNHGIISWCEMDFATVHSITDIAGTCMPFNSETNMESSPDGMLGLQVANLDGPGIAQHPVPGEIRAGSNALGFHVAGCHSKARK